jgi:tRNA (guanine37-N1)-methyltransferase
VFNGLAVPPVLLSGDHGKIAQWRREQQLLRTWQRRPDLLQTLELADEDKKTLERLQQSLESDN